MADTNNEVVIVVPVYRAELTATEEVSLTQLVRVLGRYPICFVAPHSFAGSYVARVPGARIIRLPDEYFTGKASYSHLLLTVDFYRHFADYSYVLIYQLDAFVFSDRLLEFCELGYDYIAPPVPSHSPNWREIGCNIGVGGLSLRRVASAIRILAQRDEILEPLPAWLRETIMDWEDLFFAYASTRVELDYHVPSYKVAMEFGLSSDVGPAYRRMPEWLPFGCHAFDVVDYWHYQPIINSYGYDLPAPIGAQCVSSRQMRRGRYLLERLQRPVYAERAAMIRDRLLAHIGSGMLALWGCGAYGLPLARFLRENIVCIYDRKEGARLPGVPQLPPTDELLAAEKHPIIVGALTSENELCGSLASLGKKEGCDYFRISELLRLAIKEYRGKVKLC